MAVVKAPTRATRTTTVVSGADNGDHGLLIVPNGGQGVTIGVEGTAGSATVSIGYLSGGSVVAYADATVAVAGQTCIFSGGDAEIYAIIASATATTNLTIVSNSW